MPIPSIEDFLLPSLRHLNDGSERSLDEIIAASSKVLGVTAKQQQELMPNGKTPTVKYRNMCAMTYLTKARLVKRVKKGTYKITELGKELAEKDFPYIDEKFLEENYPSFWDWMHASQKRVPARQPSNGREVLAQAMEIEEDQTPEGLENEIIELLLKKPPAAYAKTISRLMYAMGYGRTEFNGDMKGQGADGFVLQDPLNLGIIYIKADRRAPGDAVSEDEVSDFIRALWFHGFEKGIFVTTSSFPENVGDFASVSRKRVAFVDGRELAQLMVRYFIGVRTVGEMKKAKAINHDFFDE